MRSCRCRTDRPIEDRDDTLAATGSARVAKLKHDIGVRYALSFDAISDDGECGNVCHEGDRRVDLIENHLGYQIETDHAFVALIDLQALRFLKFGSQFFQR